MKNLANCITVSRILMSVLLIATRTFSFAFYVLYIYCGVSDMLDGYIARKSKNATKSGSMLDSIADITFFIISIVKIVPFINLHNEIIIWMLIITLIKISNVVCGYINYKKLIFPHTIANKITGLILFITPLILPKNNHLFFEIIICSIATFTAIQEGHFIRTKTHYS